MYRKIFLTLTTLAGLTCWAQTRTATITGGGMPDRGHCNVSVVVDGSAQVTLRGNQARVQDLSGAEPVFQRFDCTSPMPPSPAFVRFNALSGRGTQQLISQPENGGPVTVRIDDPDSGADNYSFSIEWGREPFGQVYDRNNAGRVDEGPEAYYRERTQEFRGDWHQNFFDRVRRDLDRAQADSAQFGIDQHEFRETRRELGDLQSSWASGNYNRRDLDAVIAMVTNVMQDANLNGRDRQMLNDDLDRLMRFRDRGGWR